MNKKQEQELKNLKYRIKEYGYLALNDHNKFHYLSSLDKIIKLKNQNRMLCDKRKAKILCFNKLHTTTIKGVAVRLLDHETHNEFINSIAKLSEKIGKNGHKIQRLRTKYKQFGKKWVENKLKPKRTQDICY